MYPVTLRLLIATALMTFSWFPSHPGLIVSAASPCDFKGAAANCSSCEKGYGPGYPECRKSCTADCEGHGEGYLDATGVMCECACFDGYQGANCQFCALGYQDTEPGRRSVCVATNCDFPPTPVPHQASNTMSAQCANATQLNPILHGGVCPLVCEAGYVASGSFQCNLGTFTLEHCLMQKCAPPQAPIDGSVVCNGENGLLGSVCELRCNSGFEPVGVTRVTCAVPSDALPEAIPSYQALGECKPRSCGDVVERFGVATVEYPSRTLGSIAKVTCAEGYEAISAGALLDKYGKSFELRCAPLSDTFAANVSWHGNGQSSCRRRNCTLSGRYDPHGTFQTQGLTNGSVSMLSCNPGYELSGDGIFICNSNAGLFTGSSHCSIPARCITAPPLPKHASSSLCAEHSQHDAKCDVACDSGYSARGQFRCTYGTWTSWPTCMPDGGKAHRVDFLVGQGTIDISYSGDARSFRIHVDLLWQGMSSALSASIKESFPLMGVIDVMLTLRKTTEIPGGLRLELGFRARVGAAPSELGISSNDATIRRRLAKTLAAKLRMAPGWRRVNLWQASVWFLSTASDFDVELPPGWCDGHSFSFLKRVFSEDECRDERMFILSVIVAAVLALLVCTLFKCLHGTYKQRRSLQQEVLEANDAMKMIREREAARRSSQTKGKLVRKFTKKLTRKLTTTLGRAFTFKVKKTNVCPIVPSTQPQPDALPSLVSISRQVGNKKGQSLPNECLTCDSIDSL